MLETCVLSGNSLVLNILRHDVVEERKEQRNDFIDLLADNYFLVFLWYSRSSSSRCSVVMKGVLSMTLNLKLLRDLL